MKQAILTLVILASFCLTTKYADAVESPQWWKDNRAIYASFDLSGAGGPLMKFPSEDIRDKLGTFRNLPVLLHDARNLGCNCIYLVSYWEPNYAANKGDYEIRTDLGGHAAFKEGVAKIHSLDGRIILYLEPFIITRTSQVGRKHGLDWCMKDARGRPQTYYGNSKYYLMWPGEGSGWTNHICSVAERLVRIYGVDGFHLDSYGCQWGLKDSDSKHTGTFNVGAINLVKTMRRRIQAVKSDAIIMLECCERTELLDICDGGQIESGAWLYSPVKVLNEKPWVKQKKYKAFTSHYSMQEMDRILEMGYNLSLCPWWFVNLPTEKDFAKMGEHIKRPNDWIKRMRILWNWDNLLYINTVPRPSHIDLFQLRRDLNRRQYLKPKPQYYDTDAYLAAVNAYEPRLKKLINSSKPIKTQRQYLSERLRASRK
jgi:hypothetical protein